MVNTVRGTSSKICARNGEGDKIFEEEAQAELREIVAIKHVRVLP